MKRTVGVKRKLSMLAIMLVSFGAETASAQEGPTTEPPAYFQLALQNQSSDPLELNFVDMVCLNSHSVHTGPPPIKIMGGGIYTVTFFPFFAGNSHPGQQRACGNDATGKLVFTKDLATITYVHQKIKGEWTTQVQSNSPGYPSRAVCDGKDCLNKPVAGTSKVILISFPAK